MTILYGEGPAVDVSGDVAGDRLWLSPEDGVWAFGERADDRAERLLSLEAPGFTLPDLDAGRTGSRTPAA